MNTLLISLIARYQSRIKSEEGLTTMEYAACAALILGAITLAMGTLGTNLGSVFTNLASWASGAAASTSSM